VFLVVVFAINNFRHYIIGYEVFIHIGHSTIKYFMNNPLTNSRITRWLILLHKFNVMIIDRPRKSNVVVDYLSRLDNLGQEIPIDYSFPNEHIFIFSKKIPLVWW